MFNIINTFLFQTTSIFHLTNKFATSAVEPLANVTITIVLIILILFSLVLTFSANSEAIHKVLGLLLVSVFVVFLWIFQTEFTFVYLVYILAFIGAVLMLFLSVVLMLPISTIQKHSKSQNMALFSLINIINWSEVVLYYFILIIFLYIIFNFIYLIISFVVRNKQTWSYMSLFYFVNEFTDKLKIKGTLYTFFIEKIETFFTNKYLVLLLNFIYSLIYLSIVDLLSITKQIFNLNSILFITQVLILTLLKLIENKLNSFSIQVMELLIQFIIFINLFSILIPTFIYNEKSYLNLFNSTDLTLSGLGNIKYILYENNPLFLIISTIVLLVALMGAAVMTRNKQ